MRVDHCLEFPATDLPSIHQNNTLNHVICWFSTLYHCLLSSIDIYILVLHILRVIFMANYKN